MYLGDILGLGLLTVPALQKPALLQAPIKRQTPSRQAQYSYTAQSGT